MQLLLELTEQVFKQNNNKDIYELLISSLTKIDEGLDPMVITNIIELKYLDYLGVSPFLIVVLIVEEQIQLLDYQLLKVDIFVMPVA